MKRVLLFFALLGTFALAANAQSKACCAGKKASDKTESCLKADQAAMDEAAADDASIVKQVSKDGEVKYLRKEINEKTGEVTYVDVEFCTKSNKFVNVSPSEGNPSCCTKTAKAKKASRKDGEKACCSEEEKKACCADGKHSDATKTSSGF